MITSIFAVNTVTGSGSITFFVNTDGTGCDEECSTSLQGQRFATHVTLGANATSQQSINHNKSGNHVVIVKAETSNVQSGPLVLNL
ncbi:MAG TPA: hypothetical protein VGK21_14285 [Candidatus Angelobacter sp.]